MSHKNRSEDIHKGSSKNSRRGYHRRRGSDGAYYEYFGNSTSAGQSCSFCYYKYCRRAQNKADMTEELRRLNL